MLVDVKGERWIAEGLRVLAEEGVSGLRIDKIAARIDLTKGSFFHHFDSAAHYRASLLDRWEQKALEDLVDSPSPALLEDLAARLESLVDLRLEVAVRAWAFQDPVAKAALERVDQARLRALESVWSEMVDDSSRAHAAALLPHLLVIGASVAVPQPTQQEL
ncbi:MAG: TetR/AcrR family transcriptional regulator, partial [Arachnia sp.]